MNPRNYIQINNIILSQQDLSSLRPDQIAKIERVLIEAKALDGAGMVEDVEAVNEGSHAKRVPPRVPRKEKINLNR